MIVLHAAPVRWGRIGGLQASIPSLIAAQNRLDDVHAGLLMTVAGGGEAPQLDFPVFRGGVNADRTGRLSLPAPFDRPDLVVFHSSYIPAHAKIAGMLQKHGIPYLVCPRGGMTRRAQSTKQWKKRLGNLLFFNWVVAHAAGLHYLTEGEFERSVAWKLPRFIVGNGVHLPDESELAWPGRTPGLHLLFLGRLHIDHKGLDLLVDAAAMAADEFRRCEARLDLHGPDCAGSRHARFPSSPYR